VGGGGAAGAEVGCGDGRSWRRRGGRRQLWPELEEVLRCGARDASVGAATGRS
jgi:hypothetical protein